MFEYLLGATLLGVYTPIIPKIKKLHGTHLTNLITFFICSWIFFYILQDINLYSMLKKISWSIGASFLFTINHWIISTNLKKCKKDGVQ
jgi:hypothetical protein